MCSIVNNMCRLCVVWMAICVVVGHDMCSRDVAKC